MLGPFQPEDELQEQLERLVQVEVGGGLEPHPDFPPGSRRRGSKSRTVVVPVSGILDALFDELSRRVECQRDIQHAAEFVDVLYSHASQPPTAFEILNSAWAAPVAKLGRRLGGYAR